MKPYTAEGNIVTGPGLPEGGVFAYSPENWCDNMNTAYAAGVEAGRGENVTPRFDELSRLKSEFGNMLGKVQSEVNRLDDRVFAIENAVKSAIPTDWQRRAEIAEAQVEAVVNHTDRLLKTPSHTDIARGYDRACRDVQYVMEIARERFGVK